MEVYGVDRLIGELVIRLSRMEPGESEHFPCLRDVAVVIHDTRADDVDMTRPASRPPSDGPELPHEHARIEMARS